jgi:uncharacterized protein YodC (DUF2158 family)
MGAKFKVGTVVRQIVPAPFEGAVADVHYVAEEDAFRYLVVVNEKDGAVHSRWFDESHITEKEASQ